MKVVSLNVDPLAEGADRLERLEALAGRLKGLDADIVALHGVHGDGVHVNMGRELRRRLPAYEHLVIERAERATDSGHWRGVAFLSKLPIRRHGRLALSEDCGGHAVLWARFDVEDRPFYVFNTQFAADPESAVREVRQMVPFLNVCQAPGVLVATLNVQTCREAGEYLSGHGWHNPVEAADQWAAGGYDEQLWANEFFDAPVQAEQIMAEDAPTAGPGLLTTF